MGKVDLTVVIPVSLMANRLQGLTEILDQLLTKEIEVILVHDFQDKATSVQLTKIFEARINTKCLFLIEGKFGGPGLARNAGLQIATKKYVAFWDSDDLVYFQTFIEYIGEVLKEDSDIGIAEFVSKKNQEYRRFPIIGKSFSDASRLLATHPGIWRYVFKRETIDGLKFIASRMGEDQAFIAQAIQLSKTVYLFHKPIYEYQISGDGQLTSDPKNLVCIIDSLQEVSKTHLLTEESEKREFITIIYWKMFLTLITKSGSGVSKVQLWRELVKLRNDNPRLFNEFLLQFINFKNYNIPK